VQTTDTLAARVRNAMETIDLTTMGELLAPNAKWGAPEQEVPTCQNAQEILSWFDLAQANGVRAEIKSVDVVGGHLVVGLKVLANKDIDPKAKNRTRWQVMSVRDGRIAEIRGYETRGEATDFATSGVSHWTS
jgi:ketosteroid isomerase-like protein